jgi:aspartokinase
VAVKSIAVKEDIIVVNLRPRQPAPIHRTTWSVGEALDRHEVSAHLMASSGNRVVLALDVNQQLDHLLQELGETFEVSPTKNCVIVSLVGEEIGRTPGVVTRATRVLEHIPLLMASYGASDTSASFVVSKDDVDEVVMMLHRELFGESAPSDIFVPTEVKARS